MAEISLYLANANITLTEDMGPEKSITKGKEFEFVELGDLETKEEKSARRLIHFSSGETMEESQMTWGPYVWFQMWRAASSTVSACDYLGEKMASLFGITSSKYQYAIDEYNKIKKREGVPVDSGLSEEAEELFVEPQNEETHEPNLHQPEATAAEDITTSLPVPSPSTISVHGHTVSP
ncbi:protein FAM177A1-like isoform X2 [Brachyhypopomus gauderio]|uniref:protein FAM177A1-like isoform X2 n=1 Tax=Brachyhypopomus gauderio TaxID=698409 RepID=UPI004042B465